MYERPLSHPTESSQAAYGGCSRAPPAVKGPESQLVFHLPVSGLSFTLVFCLVLNYSLTLVTKNLHPLKRDLSSHKDMTLPSGFPLGKQTTVAEVVPQDPFSLLLLVIELTSFSQALSLPEERPHFPASLAMYGHMTKM